jgi:hypothetical protein
MPIYNSFDDIQPQYVAGQFFANVERFAAAYNKAAGPYFTSVLAGESVIALSSVLIAEVMDFSKMLNADGVHPSMGFLNPGDASPLRALLQCLGIEWRDQLEPSNKKVGVLLDAVTKLVLNDRKIISGLANALFPREMMPGMNSDVYDVRVRSATKKTLGLGLAVARGILANGSQSDVSNVPDDGVLDAMLSKGAKFLEFFLAAVSLDESVVGELQLCDDLRNKNAFIATKASLPEKAGALAEVVLSQLGTAGILDAILSVRESCDPGERMEIRGIIAHITEKFSQHYQPLVRDMVDIIWKLIFETPFTGPTSIDTAIREALGSITKRLGDRALTSLDATWTRQFAMSVSAIELADQVGQASWLQDGKPAVAHVLPVAEDGADVAQGVPAERTPVPTTGISSAPIALPCKQEYTQWQQASADGSSVGARPATAAQGGMFARHHSDGGDHASASHSINADPMADMASGLRGMFGHK